MSSAPSAPSAAPVSAEKTSFQQVTAQLDPGGNLYFYLGTEQWLEGLSGKVSGLHQLLGAIPDIKPADRENLDKAFGVVTNLIKSSGVEDISGFGLSSIATEKRPVSHQGPAAPLQRQRLRFPLGPVRTKAAFARRIEPAFDQCCAGHVLRPGDSHSLADHSEASAQSGFPQAEDILNKLPEGFRKNHRP